MHCKLIRKGSAPPPQGQKKKILTWLKLWEKNKSVHCRHNTRHKWRDLWCDEVDPALQIKAMNTIHPKKKNIINIIIIFLWFILRCPSLRFMPSPPFSRGGWNWLCGAHRKDRLHFKALCVFPKQMSQELWMISGTTFFRRNSLYETLFTARSVHYLLLPFFFFFFLQAHAILAPAISSRCSDNGKLIVKLHERKAPPSVTPLCSCLPLRIICYPLPR